MAYFMWSFTPKALLITQGLKDSPGRAVCLLGYDSVRKRKGEKRERASPASCFCLSSVLLSEHSQLQHGKAGSEKIHGWLWVSVRLVRHIANICLCLKTVNYNEAMFSVTHLRTLTSERQDNRTIPLDLTNRMHDFEQII